MPLAVSSARAAVVVLEFSPDLGSLPRSVLKLREPPSGARESRKPTLLPPGGVIGWPFFTGKLVEPVEPLMMMFPVASTAIPVAEHPNYHQGRWSRAVWSHLD